MATHDDDDVSTIQEIEARVLAEGDMSAADQITTGDGWDIEDVGRVRGGIGNSMRSAADGMTSEGDDERGDDPSQLNGGLRDMPGNYIKDHSDDPDDPDAPERDAKDDDDRPEPQTRQEKRALPGRIATMRKELGTLAQQRRELREEIQREREKFHRERATWGTTAAEPGETAQTQPAASERPRDASGKFVAAQAAPAAEGAPVVPPRPIWQEYDDQNKTYDEYLSAHSDYVEAKLAHQRWEAQQEIAQARKLLEQKDREAAFSRQSAKFEARMEQVKTQHAAEWDEVCDNWDTVPESHFLEDLVMLHEAGPKVYYEFGKDVDRAAVLATYDWTKTMFDAMMATDNPTRVLTYLADNPAEFEKLTQMEPSRALYALGALDGKLANGTAVRANGPRPVRVSQARTPIRPVGGTRTTSRTAGDPTELEFGPDYVAQMNARQRERGI